MQRRDYARSQPSRPAFPYMPGIGNAVPQSSLWNSSLLSFISHV
jgi:hypothetical protein